MRSSPFSEPGQTTKLRVETGSPLAEVFLVNHDFALVDRSIGDLDAEVEQGVYKLKARLGDVTTEQLVVLTEDTTIDVSEQLSVASATPLKGTSRTYELHMEPATDESRSVTVQAGSGARVFLCARRWTRSGGEDSAPVPPPELSLRGLDGATIVDLHASAPIHADPSDPIAGTTVEVDPGSYFLRWRDESGFTAEQTVHAVRDWQTQVFLLEDAPDAATTARHGVSVVMARQGLRLDDQQLRTLEEARGALADERKVVSSLNEWLFAKFDNPMLGLFGAHLMLIADDAIHEVEEAVRLQPSRTDHVLPPVAYDQSLFDHVVHNLLELLGPDHPDAIALATRASDQPLDELRPVAVPPMLWRSWVLLIEASNARPGLVPVATWQQALRVLPLRPFLVWAVDEDESGEAVEQWQRDVARTVRATTPGAAADLLGGPSPDDTLRRLSLELLAPRAALDQLDADAQA